MAASGSKNERFPVGIEVALKGKTEREGRKMEATIREARLAGNFAEREEVVASTRYAENNLLSELPGIAFGLITLAYIIGAFVALF